MPDKKKGKASPAAAELLYEVLDESWEGDEDNRTLNMTVEVLETGEEHQYSWAPGSNPSSEKAHAWLHNWCQSHGLFREESPDEPEAETPADPEAAAESEESTAETETEEGGS